MEGYFLLTKKTGPGAQQPDKLSCMWDCLRHGLSLLCGLSISGAWCRTVEDTARGGQELPPSKFEGGAKLGKPNEAHRTTMGRSMCWNTSLVDSMLYLFRPKLAAQFPSISRAAGTRGSSSELMPEDTAAEMPGQESWN